MIRHVWTALRPKQWIKNLFVFLPFIFGQKLFVSFRLIDVSVAAVLFCLLASGCYLMNDLFDRLSDGRHPVKSRRPVASGLLQAPVAMMFSAALIFLSLGSPIAGTSA